MKKTILMSLLAFSVSSVFLFVSCVGIYDEKDQNSSSSVLEQSNDESIDDSLNNENGGFINVI